MGGQALRRGQEKVTVRSIADDLSWCLKELAEAITYPRSRGIDLWISDVLMEEALLRNAQEERKDCEQS